MKFSAKILKLKFLKEIGTFSSFIFLQMIMDQILWNIDLLLLSKYANLEEVARYSIAGQFNGYFIHFFLLIFLFFLPTSKLISISPLYIFLSSNILCFKTLMMSGFCLGCNLLLPNVEKYII